MNSGGNTGAANRQMSCGYMWATGSGGRAWLSTTPGSDSCAPPKTCLQPGGVYFQWNTHSVSTASLLLGRRWLYALLIYLHCTCISLRDFMCQVGFFFDPINGIMLCALFCVFVSYWETHSRWLWMPLVWRCVAGLICRYAYIALLKQLFGECVPQRGICVPTRCVLEIQVEGAHCLFIFNAAINGLFLLFPLLHFNISVALSVGWYLHWELHRTFTTSAVYGCHYSGHFICTFSVFYHFIFMFFI